MVMGSIHLHRKRLSGFALEESRQRGYAVGGGEADMPARKRKQKTRSFAATAPAPIVNIAEVRARRDALQPRRKPAIFLAVPSIVGKLNFTIAMTFGRAMASSMMVECPFRFGIHVEIGKRGPDYARNQIVRTFMRDTDSDWLLMIDDDQVVPEDFWKLCTVRDADVVSGLTPVWVGNKDPETMMRVNNYGVNPKGQCYNLRMPDESVKSPYRVPIVGTGCIAIRRRVFAPKPHGLGDAPFYFTHEADRKVQAGEDINFSVEANRCGFILAVHPSVRFDHMKEIPLWQIEEYYQARNKMEVEGRQSTDDQRISIG